VGASALAANSSGSLNTAVGYEALATNTDNSANTAVGYRALKTQGAGVYQNTAMGAEALTANTTGVNNSAFGRSAMFKNTSGGNNVAVGFETLRENLSSSNNTAVGYQAGCTNQTGSRSVLVGATAGYAATALDGDTHIGYSAGSSQTTGFANTFVGSRGNASINEGAGKGVTSGTYNTFIGGSAGGVVTSGSKNTILGNYTGNQGGLDIRTASNYIVLSDGDGNPRGIFDSSGNLLVGTTSAINSGLLSVGGRITAKTTTAGSEALDLWNSATTGDNYFAQFSTETSITVRGSITYNRAGGLTVYNTTSDYRLKEHIVDLPNALETVSRLKPRQFDWKETGNTTTGFIAHELAEVCPHAVTGEKDATAMQQYEISPAIPATQDEEGNELTAAVEAVMGEREVPRYQGIDTSFLVATLTAAIQEQQAIITALTTRITALEAK
jgi:hypothetical protein